MRLRMSKSPVDLDSAMRTKKLALMGQGILCPDRHGKHAHQDVRDRRPAYGCTKGGLYGVDFLWRASVLHAPWQDHESRCRNFVRRSANDQMYEIQPAAPLAAADRPSLFSAFGFAAWRAERPQRGPLARSFPTLLEVDREPTAQLKFGAAGS